MKKLITIGKVALLTIIFVLGMTNICFADVFIIPRPKQSVVTSTFITLVVLTILLVGLLITAVCMIIFKANKSDGLLKKSKKIGESLIYYILFTTGILIIIGLADAFDYSTALRIISTLIGLAFLITSLFTRMKNKKISYIVLGMYLESILLLMLFIEMIDDISYYFF